MIADDANTPNSLPRRRFSVLGDVNDALDWADLGRRIRVAADELTQLAMLFAPSGPSQAEGWSDGPFGERLPR